MLCLGRRGAEPLPAQLHSQYPCLCDSLLFLSVQEKQRELLKAAHPVRVKHAASVAQGLVFRCCCSNPGSHAGESQVNPRFVLSVPDSWQALESAGGSRAVQGAHPPAGQSVSVSSAATVLEVDPRCLKDALTLDLPKTHANKTRHKATCLGAGPPEPTHLAGRGQVL